MDESVARAPPTSMFVAGARRARCLALSSVTWESARSSWTAHLQPLVVAREILLALGELADRTAARVELAFRLFARSARSMNCNRPLSFFWSTEGNQSSRYTA